MAIWIDEAKAVQILWNAIFLRTQAAAIGFTESSNADCQWADDEKRERGRDEDDEEKSRRLGRSVRPSVFGSVQTTAHRHTYTSLSSMKLEDTRVSFYKVEIRPGRVE